MNEERKTTQTFPGGQEHFDYWQTLYRNTWQPFLNMPQLGLMRYYQDHFNQSADKYWQLQGMLAEFTAIFCRPIEQAVREELFSADLQSNDIQEIKALYAKWLSILERQYLDLFRSPEYTRCLKKTVQSFSEFITSRRTVLEDILKILPIPNHSEMDELYKEFYELKRRLRDLENDRP